MSTPSTSKDIGALSNVSVITWFRGISLPGVGSISINRAGASGSSSPSPQATNAKTNAGRRTKTDHPKTSAEASVRGLQEIAFISGDASHEGRGFAVA